MTLHPEYVIDSRGRKKAVLLSVEEYKELLEIAQDVWDSALIDEVKDESTISWVEVKARHSKRSTL